ncbi:uncharacterized protein PFB0765w-like [Amblyraja radiata]|uniref:uncharacterized protein PFB0765w-like n=1 Tax=Amblyraja radiata TaxID=386614 RepID=UPI001402E38C|nr:uncharacterized protein PFB0765w-like [Amblyraja radiata]
MTSAAHPAPGPGPAPAPPQLSPTPPPTTGTRYPATGRGVYLRIRAVTAPPAVESTLRGRRRRGGGGGGVSPPGSRSPSGHCVQVTRSPSGYCVPGVDDTDPPSSIPAPPAGTRPLPELPASPARRAGAGAGAGLALLRARALCALPPRQPLSAPGARSRLDRPAQRAAGGSEVKEMKQSLSFSGTSKFYQADESGGGGDLAGSLLLKGKGFKAFLYGGQSVQRRGIHGEDVAVGARDLKNVKMMDELKGAMSKDEVKDKTLKMDSKDEESKTLKKVSSPQHKSERQLRSRKPKNNIAENNLNKMNKEDDLKMQVNKEIKVEKNEICDKNEKKIQGNMLKRSSCQESFEDMLLDMDEQLKEFCAKKQKNKNKKFKKREKISSNQPQDQKESSLNSRSDNELEAGIGDQDATEKITTGKLTSKETPERGDHFVEEPNVNMQTEPVSSEEDGENPESEQVEKNDEHAEDPSTKLVEDQDVDEDGFPVECAKKRAHCDVNSNQRKNEAKRIKIEKAEEEDEIPETSYGCKRQGKKSVKQRKDVKNRGKAKGKKEKKTKHLKKEEEKNKKEEAKWKWYG